MTYGLQIMNPSNELVLSSETYLPIYLGRATLDATYQPSGTGDAATGVGVGGGSYLTYNFSGQIIPVLALPAGRKGSIYSCTQEGSTWTIFCSYTDGSVVEDIDSPMYAMHTQLTPTVYCFGFATGGPLGDYGLALYNAAGELTVDLTRRPLLIRQRILLPSGTATQTIAAMTLPGVLGRATDTYITGGPTGVPSQVRLAISASIFSVSGTTFTRNWDRRSLRTTTSDDPPIPARLDATNLWLVECTGLP